MDINYEKLGKKITSLRKALDMKAPELARECNLSAGFINLIERGGGSTPTVDNLQKIAEILQTDLDTLLMDSLTIYNSVEIDSIVDRNLLNSFYALERDKRECALDILRDYISFKEVGERETEQESPHMLQLKERMKSSTYIQEMIAELAPLSEPQQRAMLDIIKAAAGNIDKMNL